MIKNPDRFRKIGFLLIAVGIVLAVYFWCATSVERYHLGIIKSAGLNKQSYEHLGTDYDEAGLDFWTAVCLGITDLESSENWTDFDSRSERDTEVLTVARAFYWSHQCVNADSSLLVLKVLGPKGNPNYWEILLLDKRAKRLLLLAGDI